MIKTGIACFSSSSFLQLIRSKGGKYLEAPVSGSKKPAHDGQLVILTAGDEDLYNRAIPAFQAMGKIHYYLGTKMCMQCLTCSLDDTDTRLHALLVYPW